MGKRTKQKNSVTCASYGSIYKVQSLVDGGYRVSVDLTQQSLDVVQQLLSHIGKPMFVTFAQPEDPLFLDDEIDFTQSL